MRQKRKKFRKTKGLKLKEGKDYFVENKSNLIIIGNELLNQSNYHHRFIVNYNWFLEIKM